MLFVDCVMTNLHNFSLGHIFFGQYGVFFEPCYDWMMRFHCDLSYKVILESQAPATGWLIQIPSPHIWYRLQIKKAWTFNVKTNDVANAIGPLAVIPINYGYGALAT